MPDNLQGPKPRAGLMPELLTDQQAAERMGWSRVKIQRLRLSGKLPYFPGRPALIDAADLADVVPAEARRREKQKLAREQEAAARAALEAEEAPARRAKISWLRYRMREDRKIEEHNKKVRAASEAALRAALADDD